MTDYAQTKFSEDLLIDLGVIGVGDSAPGAHHLFINRRLQTALARLEERGLVDWDITGDIPDSRYQPLLQYMHHVAPAFGITPDPRVVRGGLIELHALAELPFVSDESICDY